MDTLANNEEQRIRVCTERDLEDLDELEGVVASRRELFVEADEIRRALSVAVKPDLEPQACREACQQVGDILTSYQEQPGLLDPYLEEMVELLMGAISGAVRAHPQKPQSALPNLHLLSSLLYVLTTVRGYKTVARFFPHEAADLEPCLEAAEAEHCTSNTDTWSTLYSLVLWLAMVLLTPFDLKSIDSGGHTGLAQRIFELGTRGLHSPGRLRDASAWLLAKYFARPDVTAASTLQRLVSWTKARWQPHSDDAVSESTALGFAKCGAFQAWNQTLKAAPRGVLRNVWSEAVALALEGPAGNGDQDFEGSSALRKLRVRPLSCQVSSTCPG
jgi:hypothetical protein